MHWVNIVLWRCYFKVNIMSVNRTHSNTGNIKYGLGKPFKECGLKDYKKKKLFQEKFDPDEF